MSTLDRDRLIYLHDTLSYRDISERTGIPLSTVGYVIRGERELGADYRDSLRMTYRQQVFIDYRQIGAAQDVASRYVLATTHRARSVLEDAKKMNAVYVNNLVLRKILQYDRRGESYDLPTLWKEARELVIAAHEWSKSDPDEWTEEGS